MEPHPKFATWLSDSNITLNDETLRKWWAGLEAFQATAPHVVSLVNLAQVADVETIASSEFHATLRKQDAALLPKQAQAVAVLAAAKLHHVVEQGSKVGEFAALLSAVNFPSFEDQPQWRNDLTKLAERTLAEASRARADLRAVVKHLDEESEAEVGLLTRSLAVTAEETNILWWIFGGRSRDSNDAFGEIAEDVIPFVAAKELADLTTLLPGHVAVGAFADRVSQAGRNQSSAKVAVKAAIKKLPERFVNEITQRWKNQPCLPFCRVTNEITNGSGKWRGDEELRTTDLSLLFYRECLIPRAWEKASS